MHHGEVSQTEVDLHGVGVKGDCGTPMTQEVIARLLGISQAQLSKYELGQSAPPLGVLIRLAEKCGKSTDWILTGRS